MLVILIGETLKGYKKIKTDTEKSKIINKYAVLNIYCHNYHYIQVYMYDFVYIDLYTMPHEDYFPDTKIFI